ncbi:M14 family metallopeptidase [Xanthovirga aplysinae]|uniref:M14 family metallopeptidase n=1 Tax=Xanthovirga aplysinae TaxID=2529853 RepID=UPI0012BCCFF3|nr:M14 family zinc carboxypeptidase [Xanthovirga aplysinae]MTI32822.1 zinc carboxypeptidase [Xanthovirga aplysinae]
MKRLFGLALGFIFSVSCLYGQSALKSPEEFLGYPLGERFTPYFQVVNYYEYLASNSPKVKLITYGETYEHRPLKLAFVSSPENVENLEQIRKDNLRRAGILEGAPSSPVGIVWLSYNVHGNEASSTEASMKTIFELVQEDSKKSNEYLENTLVIMDPCMNPDGRDRYVNFYTQYGNLMFNPDVNSAEHQEPWPGGRPNHYLFDLNRDWAWQTQVESRKRLEVYNQWLPQIHVDFHEQGYNSPYYFAPAAEPFHEVITKWQREFQQEIGKNHAKYFDQNGWLYFTRERFDLLYPSYGDTYPTYNGAIGMTYEQAGHGMAGLGVLTQVGDTLSLKDRIDHHFTTGLSTIEIASKNREMLLEEFGEYFREARNEPKGAYKTYVISSRDDNDKLNKLTAWLDEQGILYGTSGQEKSLKGFDYSKGKESNFRLSSSDLIISAYQPKSALVKVLFEPQTALSDSVTYDITAWSVPYVYGLKAYALKNRLMPSGVYSKPDFTQNKLMEKPYAYLAPYHSVKDANFLAQLIKAGIKVRSAENSFTQNGNQYEAGTLIITRANNRNLGDKFDEKVIELAQKLERKITAAPTGLVSDGSDFGAGSVRYINPPKVAVLFGERVSSLNYGEIWYYFEQELDYQMTALSVNYFDPSDLSKYNTLILPAGSYNFSDEQLNQLKSWVRNGGKLISISSALNAFVNKEGFGLKQYLNEEEKEEAKLGREELTKREMLANYQSRERRYMSQFIPGAIYRVSLDSTHPLAFGYGKEYFTLKNSSQRCSFLEKGWNVGVIKDNNPLVSGFAGSDVNKEINNSLVFGVHDMGRGEVIYMVDDPLFRAFWENGKLLFSNALFMVGN